MRIEKKIIFFYLFFFKKIFNNPAIKKVLLNRFLLKIFLIKTKKKTCHQTILLPIFLPLS